MKSVLIVEDDTTFALMLKTWLERKGFTVRTTGTVEAAEKLLATEQFSIVLTDMRLPGQDGIYLLQWLADNQSDLPAIVMTSYADIQTAVRSIKLGAKDYISKPINPDELLRKMEEAMAASASVTGPSNNTPEQQTKPAKHHKTAYNQADYIEGKSEAARRLYDYVRLVAPTNLSVLINGASGTGKEHIARMIHLESKRADKPFVAIDCGAISRELAASEFFGHVKGSFTGALTDKTGAFVAANGGTLFLDEVGNLGYETQIQLLRALQERKIRPVGSNTEIDVDIRLVTATNENLEAAIAKGSFREDLYHRLNEFSLHMPDLAEQRDDIMLYAEFFLRQANQEFEKQLVGFDAGATTLMLQYGWPGNLRQMRNTVRCAALLARTDHITASDLPAEITASAIKPVALHDPQTEIERIRHALELTGQNKSKAAKLLGIDRKTLYNKLKTYGIE